jgi:hypothetical protein
MHRIFNNAVLVTPQKVKYLTGSAFVKILLPNCFNFSIVILSIMHVELKLVAFFLYYKLHHLTSATENGLDLLSDVIVNLRCTQICDVDCSVTVSVL